MDSFTNPTQQRLYSPATSVQGSWLTPSELIGIAQSRYPGKIYRPLKHWIIIDVLHSKPEVESIRQRGFNPVIIYGRPTNTGNSINNEEISDYQISFEGCFFETDSIVYILIGDGSRQTLDSQLVGMLDTFR